MLVLLPWGSMTDHPRSLPASPEASGVDDVVRRCPPQGTQTDSELSTIFSVAPYALKVLWSEGTLVAWPQPGTSLFMPFSEGKIGRTVLLFPLVTSYAASHAVDAADSGHTGPIKNGDAFERLGL